MGFRDCYERQQEQRRRDGAFLLHDLCESLRAGGLTEGDLAELLDAQREWYAADVVYELAAHERR